MLLGIGVGHVLKVLAGGENVREFPRECAHPHHGILFIVIDLEVRRGLLAKSSSEKLMAFLASGAILLNGSI